MVVISDKNPFKDLMDQQDAVAAAACPPVMDDGDVMSNMPSSSLQISGAMVLSDKNPFKAIMDQEKAQGLNKDQYELGMKVWLQTQMGTQCMGHLPRLTSTVPLAEEAAVAAAACPSVVDGDGVFSLMPSSLDFSGSEGQTDAMVLSDKNPFKTLEDQEKAAVAAATCPAVVDDGWTSFMFSMIRRMVSEENGRAELWGIVLQLKEQALVQEAQAKLDLLSCRPRCGQEAGEGPLMDRLHVTSQLMHQQAQMKKLSQATQAPGEDRKLLLKHLTDMEAQRAATIQLQKQAEAYRKELHDLPLAKQGELEETFQKNDLLLAKQSELEENFQKNDLLLAKRSELEETFQKNDLLLAKQSELEETFQKNDLLLAKQSELEENFLKSEVLCTPECEVASKDATAVPDVMEDPQYKNDFESHEGEAEDGAEFLLTDSAVSGAEETPGGGGVSAPSDQQVLDRRNCEVEAGPSDSSAQDHQASCSTEAGQAGSKQVTTPTRQLQVQALDTPHHPGKVEMLVHHAVQEMWQSFELGQGPKDLSRVQTPMPSEQYLVMDTPAQVKNSSSGRSYNKLIFDLSWETLQDLCAKDPTTQPVWKQIQPERHNYVNKLKYFDDLSKVQNYITEEVFKLCGLQEDVGAYGKVFARNFKGFNMEKYDQILIKEIPVEEHQWRDQDREAYDVKNKYAKMVFDHLMDDTLTCLLGLSKS